MLRIITKNRIAVSLLILISGCSEDFISLDPQSKETQVSFFSSFESADLAVTNAYSVMNRSRIIDFYPTIVFGSIASDDADVGGFGPTDGVEYRQINVMDHDPSIDIFRVQWSYLFRGVYHCNFALENFSRILQSNTEINMEKYSQRIGELKFLRAFYYFTLAKIYGGVPLIDHVYDPDQYLTLERASLSETYHFIKNDLWDATKKLPQASNREMIPESELGRATKGAAKSLLSMVYLFESSYAKNYSGDVRFADMKEYWDSTLYYAEEVINSGEYYLLGLEGERYVSEFYNETSGYRQIWTLAGENSSESVFEMQAEFDDKNWIASRGSITNVHTSVRSFYNSDGSTSALGWGFNTPTEDLVSEYEVGDPRLKSTILGVNDSVLVYGDQGLDWYKADLQHSETGYMGRKYEVHPDFFWKKPGFHNNKGPSNYKLIRFAEIILVAAEAALELNDDSKATEYVNLIRKRARNSGNDPSVLPDHSSVTLQDIIHERRIELALEGQRFYDLVRWGIAEHEINDQQLFDGNPSFEKGKNEFFPIPQSEVNGTDNLIKQNDNY